MHQGEDAHLALGFFLGFFFPFSLSLSNPSIYIEIPLALSVPNIPLLVRERVGTIEF